MAKANVLNLDVRAMRAKQFADQITHALQEFLPADRETQRRIHDHLAKQAYETNALIVNLPPEYDALTQLKAERAMLDKLLAPILVEK